MLVVAEESDCTFRVKVRLLRGLSTAEIRMHEGRFLKERAGLFSLAPYRIKTKLEGGRGWLHHSTNVQVVEVGVCK